MKKITFLITFFSLTITMCYAQFSDEEKYEQASNYYEAKEYEKAIPILKELADKNHAKALNLLGVFYNYGYIVPKNMQKAVELYQKSADLGWRGAQRNIGICYDLGEGVSQNKENAYIWYDKAFRQYKELAEKGDADAQLEMGAIYYHGRIRSGKDYSKALPWLEKSANQGNDKALNLLGLMYQFSYGVEKDVNKAYNYYLKGAEKGNCYAQRNLAWLFQDEQFRELHSSGEGETYHEDFDFNRQTEKWLRIAAQNNADYMYELARFYLNMQVLDEWQDKNPFAYLNRAVEAGSAIAMACSGEHNMYEKQYDKASVLLRSAKEKGITTFSSFVYEIEEETNIDICLMILQHLKKNPDIKLDSYKKFNEDQYLLSVINGEGNKSLILMSKTGSVLNKTPYFHDIWLSEFTNEHNLYPYIYFSTSPDNHTQYVYFTNKSIRLDIMDGIYKFMQQNNGYMIQNANYNGGEYIYVVVSNDKEEHSYMKINKAGKIVKFIPFADNKMYVMCDEENINLAYGENIYLINSKIDLDIIFTVLDFLLSNTDYRLDLWQALFVNDNYLLIHEQKRGEDTYYKWSNWFKLSTTGKVLGKTMTETDNEIEYYSSEEKYFYYYDHKDEKSIKFNLQEMLKRIK